MGDAISLTCGVMQKLRPLVIGPGGDPTPHRRSPARDCAELGSIGRGLARTSRESGLILQIARRSATTDAHNGARCGSLEPIIHDKKEAQNSSDYLLFFFPFSTTLVQIVLDRKVDDTVLCLGDFSRG